MRYCECCGEETKTQLVQNYRYLESGLNNVYLDNVETTLCEGCGDHGVILPRIGELHETIAQAIALQPFLLDGDEIRFLRKHLRMKARQWAALLRVDVSTFSRWENKEKMVGSQSDALIRFLYFTLQVEQRGGKLPEKLAERIAAVNEKLRDVPSIKINLAHPGIFSYEKVIEESVITSHSLQDTWSINTSCQISSSYLQQEVQDDTLAVAA